VEENRRDDLVCKILRGIPGSGKSTTVRRYKNAKVFSADTFFEKPDGTYKVDVTQLPAAHADCLRRFIVACQAETPVVVVDNTNVTINEIAPYVEVAAAYGYHVQIITLICDPVEAHKRNIHSVPLRTCNKRAALLDEETARFPRWWNHTVTQTGPSKVAS
jgi:predicted kinase